RNNKFELCELCTGFSFSFLVFHRVTTRVNDAANSGSIRLWYPIPFQRRLRGEGKLQLLRGKNVSRRGRSSCSCFCEVISSREGGGRVAVVSARGGRVAIVFARKECLAKREVELRLFLQGNIFSRGKVN